MLCGLANSNGCVHYDDVRAAATGLRVLVRRGLALDRLDVPSAQPKAQLILPVVEYDDLDGLRWARLRVVRRRHSPPPGASEQLLEDGVQRVWFAHDSTGS